MPFIDGPGIEKQTMWTPPPEGGFQLNVDAATSSKDQKAGLGAVIRDSRGKVVAAGIQQTLLKGNVSLAEAEEVHWGMQVARKVGLSSLIIESDCLEVVELANNIKGIKSEIFWTISEIKKQRSSLQDVKVKFVP